MNKNTPKHTCIVCNEKYEDLFKHLTGSETGILTFKDEKHANYFDEIVSSRFHTEFKLSCFCGGYIGFWGYATETSPHWEASCTECGFLYDED